MPWSCFKIKRIKTAQFADIWFFCLVLLSHLSQVLVKSQFMKTKSKSSLLSVHASSPQICDPSLTQVFHDCWLRDGPAAQCATCTLCNRARKNPFRWRRASMLGTRKEMTCWKPTARSCCLSLARSRRLMGRADTLTGPRTSLAAASAKVLIRTHFFDILAGSHHQQQKQN